MAVGGCSVDDAVVERLGYRPNLDGLRAVAVCLVLAYHLNAPGIMQGGWIGVDVFFVLSGFLITRLLAEEWGRTGRIDLRAFYLRRGRRLLPSAVVVLVLVAIVEQDGRSSLPALGYVANWMSMPEVLGHTWSLSMEEQFYLVVPVILGWLVHRGGASGAFRVFVGLLLIAALASLALHGSEHADHFLRGLLGLLLGCTVALAYCSGWKPRHTAIPAAVGVAYLTLFVVIPRPESFVFHGGLIAADFAATAIVVHLVERPDLLTLRPLVELGRRSYGVYLWSWPIFVLAPVAIGWCVPISLAVAWVSYRWIESPFLTRKSRQALEPGRKAGESLAAKVAVAG